MSPLTFFATTGAVTWAYLSWRVVRFIRNIPNRLHQWRVMRRRKAWERSDRSAWNQLPPRPEYASRPMPPAFHGARRPARFGPYL